MPRYKIAYQCVYFHKGGETMTLVEGNMTYTADICTYIYTTLLRWKFLFCSCCNWSQCVVPHSSIQSGRGSCDAALGVTFSVKTRRVFGDHHLSYYHCLCLQLMKYSIHTPTSMVLVVAFEIALGSPLSTLSVPHVCVPNSNSL